MSLPAYPVAATLGVTDNLNGSANASVGGTGGKPWTLFRQPWNHTAGGSNPPVAVTTGTGDGVVTTAVQAYGFHLWWLGVESGVGSGLLADMSRVVFRPLVDPTATVHDRVLDAVVSLVRSLNLSGIGATALKVQKRWFPQFVPGTDDATGAGEGLPMIIVSPYPREVPLGLLTNRDDVGYPVILGLFDRTNETMDENITRNLKWRRQIAAAFRAQQLAGVPEVVVCEWQPESIVGPDTLAQQMAVGAMGFMFRSRETRGLVA